MACEEDGMGVCGEGVCDVGGGCEGKVRGGEW